MKYILCLFILFIFSGCKKKKDTIDKSLIGNVVKSERLVSFENALIDSVIFKSFKIILLETNDESIFRDINRISIVNEHIYILDNRLDKICIFDSKGEFINQIHSIGQGPEEYNAIIDFCFDERNNEIIVLCDRPYKLMRFSSHGDFIRQTTYSDYHREISIDSGSLFCLLNESKEKYEIGCFDQEFQITYKGIETRRKINKDCYNFGYNLIKSKYLNYTRRFDSFLYHISPNGIERKYEFDFGKYSFPTELAYEDDCEKLYKACMDGEYIYSITNAIESETCILFSTNLGTCLYDKKTNQLSGYKMLLNQSLNLGSNIYYPNEGNGNTVIMSLHPETLEYYKGDTIKNNSIINDLIRTVLPDDNPILFVYEFK